MAYRLEGQWPALIPARTEDPGILVPTHADDRTVVMDGAPAIRSFMEEDSETCLLLGRG